MPYTAEISRTNPTCFLFLVDQSTSMQEPFGAQPGRRKAEGVADAINRLLHNLTIKSAKSDGVRDYFYAGVIGYGDKAASALGGTLAGQVLVSVSAIAHAPLRLEQRTRKVEDGAGGLVEQTVQFPVWFEPVADGWTSMCQALALAQRVLSAFLSQFPGCYPPIVINITDGDCTDGNPLEAAAALRSMASSDGNVLLFNAHVSGSQAAAVEYASSEGGLPDEFARLLFAMSSPLPPLLLDAARADGFAVTDGSRGFVFNADLVSIIRFLDIGTRVSRGVR